MAKHSGIGGVVKMGGVVIGNVTNWSVDESSEEIDTTDADDDWNDGVNGHKSWTWDATFRLNEAAGANQTIRAGDVVALEFYSDTAASGKTYYSGSGKVGEHGIASPHDNVVDRSYSGVGRGALSKSTVV